MWPCPVCGSQFKNKNQWHSCGKFTVEQFLEGCPDGGVALYRALEASLLAMPGVDVRPVKTRILFRCQASFASVEKVADGWLSFTFGLRRQADHALVRKAFLEDGTIWSHTARIASPTELDSLLGLLDEARTTVGGGQAA